MSKRRGHRGNGRAMFGVGADEVEEIERPEDSIVVVDPDGNPIDDGYEPLAEEIDEPAPLDTAEDDPLEVLQRNKAELEQRHTQATAELERTKREKAELERDNHVTTKALFATALADAQNNLKAAKSKYADAMRQQDFEGAADAQEAIARHTQEVTTIDAASRELGDKPAPRTQPRETPTPVNFTLAVDRYISQLTPEQQKFARKHREKLFPEGDDKPLKKVLALSNVAALEHGVDTPEFFSYIEKNMGLSDEQKPAPVVRQKRPPVASAPVGRGAPRQTVQVELTAAERQIAARMGLSPAKYALHKKRISDGAKDPEYRGPRYSRDDPATNGGR